MQSALPRSVSAIIVTLDPAHEALDVLLEMVMPQVSAIVVVDNSASMGLGPLVQARGDAKLTLIENGRNVGLAEAQNQGIRRAMEKGTDYVLLLDQDSVPAGNMVECLVAALESSEQSKEKLGAAGPVFVDSRSGARSRFVQLGPLGSKRVRCRESGQEIVRADILIASGMLIPTRVLRNVGLMDESLFIDYVDTEWCLRARAKGYHMLGVCAASMSHQLGDRPAPSVWGRRFFVRSPARHYFFFRNSVLLYRKGYPPLTWKIGDALRLFPHAVAVLVFCAPRLQHLKAIARGIVDGFRGRSGPLPVALA